MTNKKEPTEDEMLRYRLLIKTSVMGNMSLKKCSEEYFSYIEHIFSNCTQEESHEVLDRFLWNLAWMEFEAQKSQVIDLTYTQEIQHYDTLQQDIDTMIEQVTDEITALKQFQQEKILRGYKEEYESLAKKVQENASREQLQVQLQGIEKQYEENQVSMKQIQSQLNLRSKQFALLMRTIDELSVVLQDEDISPPSPVRRRDPIIDRGEKWVAHCYIIII